MDCVAVCVMYVMQFGLVEWKEVSFMFLIRLRHWCYKK